LLYTNLVLLMELFGKPAIPSRPVVEVVSEPATPLACIADSASSSTTLAMVCFQVATSIPRDRPQVTLSAHARIWHLLLQLPRQHLRRWTGVATQLAGLISHAAHFLLQLHLCCLELLLPDHLLPRPVVEGVHLVGHVPRNLLLGERGFMSPLRAEYLTAMLP
jgi:hypothetical protein